MPKETSPKKEDIKKTTAVYRTRASKKDNLKIKGDELNEKTKIEIPVEKKTVKKEKRNTVDKKEIKKAVLPKGETRQAVLEELSKRIQNKIKEGEIQKKDFQFNKQETKEIKEKFEKRQELMKKLDETRAKYAEHFNKFSKKDKKNPWYVKLGRFFTGPETTKVFQKSETDYRKAVEQYGKQLLDDKIKELGATDIPLELQKVELDKYKNNEIFSKVILEEREKLNALKAESLSVNPETKTKEENVLNKGMNWWKEQPRSKKIIAMALLVGGSYFAISQKEEIRDFVTGDVKIENNDSLLPKQEKGEEIKIEEEPNLEKDTKEKNKVSKTKEDKIPKTESEKEISYIEAEEIPKINPWENKTTKINKEETVSKTENPAQNKNIETAPAPETKEEEIKIPETEKNYFNLSQDKLTKVGKVYEGNINYLFPDNRKSLIWDVVKNDSKNLTANKMLTMKLGKQDKFAPLVTYLRGLESMTELEANDGETIDQYMQRALQKMAQMKILNEAKLTE